MRYPHILAALRSAKWAVTPATLQAIRDTLSARLTGRIAEMPIDDESDNAEPIAPYEMIAPGVASVRLCGIIGRNLSALEMLCGGCDLACVEDNLEMALTDPMVATVVLDIDSPGGTVGGVAEFAAKIGQLAAASGKPVWAYTGGMCCSAAYWIACGCAGIACAPSAEIGSIGVMMAHVDESENWAKDGYKLILIKSGSMKGGAVPGSVITDEQIAHWQAEVDYAFAPFKSIVTTARPKAKDEIMQGATYHGGRAMEMGLVDGIYPDLASFAAQIAPVAQLMPAPTP